MKSFSLPSLAASRSTRPSARPSLALRALMVALLAVFSLSALLAPRVEAASTPTLYSFLGGTTDGANPEAPPVEDANGNLWGTTLYGGSASKGTVWEITKASATSAVPTKETIISFTNANGAYPIGGLCLGSDGNLYGTTYQGGANGFGAFFKVVPTTGVLTLLYSIKSSDPEDPTAAPVQDPNNGYFYFSCFNGGTYSVGGLLAISNTGVEEYSYSCESSARTSSTNDYDPESPVGSVAIAKIGSSYYVFGTATREYHYPSTTVNSGVIYILPDNFSSSTVAFTVFAAFPGAAEFSTSGLIADASGNLYGTTANGGTNGIGKVFKFVPSVTASQPPTGTVTTLYSLPTGGPSAMVPAFPQGTLAINTAGTYLYGTTSAGGASGYSSTADGLGHGTNYTGGDIFSTLVASPYTTANVYAFTSAVADSKNFYSTAVTYSGYFNPTEYLYWTSSGLILAPDGYYYGTGFEGGSAGNNGTVYKFGPPWTYNYTFFTPGGATPTPVTMNLAINDYTTGIADTYTLASPTAPTHGTISTPLTGGPTASGASPITLPNTYTPAVNYAGLDTFTYTATNSIGTSKTGASAFGNVSIYVGTLTATAAPTAVSGTTTTLTPGGTLTTSADTTLIYTWSTTGSGVTFSAANGTHGAGTTAVTATFTAAGTYPFTLTATAPDGTILTASTASVVVTATVGTFTLSYSPNPVGVGATSNPTTSPAALTDQFGATYTPTYSAVDSGGANSTINAATGVLTAGSATGSVSIIATAGGKTANATVTVTTPQVVLATAASANNASPTLPASGTFTASTVTLRASGTYGGTGGNTAIIYTWTNTGPSGVTYAPNGTNAAGTSVATFTQAGTYVFTVTMTAPTGTPVTSQVTVIVTAAAASITISPLGLNTSKTTRIQMELDTQLQFTATVKDQFGNTIASPTVTWGYQYSGDTITSTGLFTLGNGTGNDYVSATSNGITAYSYIYGYDDNPSITSITATPNPVTGTTTTLSSVATYPTYSPALQATPSPNSFLTYDWYQDSGPATATLSNGGVGSSVTATFTKAGSYVFEVDVTSASGDGFTYSTITVTVSQTLTTLSIAPVSGTIISPSGTQSLTASGGDQFGNTMTVSSVTWAITSGGGSLSSTTTNPTTFTAPGSAGSVTITATSAGKTGTATYTIQAINPVITSPAKVSGELQPSFYAGTDTDSLGDTYGQLEVSATYAGSGGTSSLTYNWTYTGPSGVTFSDNNDTTANYISDVSFTQAGTYVFTVTVRSPSGTTATSSVTFILQQLGSSVKVVPPGTNSSPFTIQIGKTQQFTATEYDQFGIALTSQPTFTWTAVFATVTNTGFYTATYRGGTGYDGVTATAADGNNAETVILVTDGPLTITTATATPNPVTGTTTALSATCSWAGNASDLVYQWTKVTGPGTVTLSPSNSSPANANQNTMATFTAAGTYTFQVTVSTPTASGYATQTVSRTITVTVNATVTTVTVTATPAALTLGPTTSALSAVVKDQFGTVITGQTFTWTIMSGPGTLNTATGTTDTYNSTNPGTSVVKATDGSVSGTATIVVTDAAPTLTGITVVPSPVTGTTATLSVTGNYNGSGPLTYAWSTTGTPPASVGFSGGTSGNPGSSVSTTATFTKAGSYTVQVIATDPSGLSSAPVSVTFTVNATLTSVTVAPNTGPVLVAVAGTQQFTATAKDQFGNTILGQTFAWTVTNSGGAVSTINGSGLLSAGGVPGNAVVKATDSALNGTSAVTIVDVPPTYGTITINPNPVTGTTGVLSVTGSYMGSANLTYAWTTTSAPSGGSATFSPATSSSASGISATTTATFTKAGTYTVQVTVSDASGGTATGSITFTVNQTLTTVVVTPAAATLAVNGSQQFTAVADDQFGNVIAGQTFTWSVANSGGAASSITSGGLLSAGPTSGTATVKATDGAVFGTATVTITDSAPTVATAASATPNPVTGTTTALSVLGAYTYGEGSLTYTWSATGPATVTFSANGTNAAKNTTATFTAAGTYTFTVTISNPSGQTVTSTVTVVVNQTPTAITVVPNPKTLSIGTTQTFTASATDQFGAAISGATFTWSRTGVGSIDATGLYTAGTVSGTATVKATAGTASGTASVTVTDLAPTLSAITVNPNPVTGTTAALSVTGSYTGGGTITYAWATTSVPAGGAASFSGGTSGASGAAVTTTATFTKAGSYTVQVTATSSTGTTATQSVTFTVNATYSSVTASPNPASVSVGGTQTFTAIAYDQFHNALTSQPTFTWTLVSGVGSITGAGVYTAGGVPGNAVVKVTSGAFSDTASITVGDVNPTLGSITVNPNPVTGTTATLTVTGTYVGSGGLTYLWETVTAPAGGSVTFSGGTSGASGAAVTTTATFTKAGSYTVRVTVSDTNGGTAVKTVTFTVNQTGTTVVVSPTAASVGLSATQQFTAQEIDQFGDPLATQPTFTWSVSSGGGTVSASGLYTAPIIPGTATVKAVSTDSLFGTASVTITNTPPTVSQQAAANGTTVSYTTTANTVALTVLGTYIGGESTLTYTWSYTGGTGVTFSGATNGTNAAKNITATFTNANTFTFLVTITDPLGASVTSTVNVTINQSLTTVTVTPNPDTEVIGAGTQTFTAIAGDQFGNPLGTQPTFTWSNTGVGSVNGGTGVYTIGTTPGTATIKAVSGGVSGTASVTVSDVAPTVATAASATPNPVTGTTTALSVLGQYTSGESALTYTWSASPSAGVTFSVNGTNAAKNTTATFTAAGTYTFTVTIADAFGGSVTSTVTVVVSQTATTVTVSPSTKTLSIGGTQTFTASVADQFGAAITGQTFTWSRTGVGSVNAGGVYTAGLTPGTAVVTASTGGAAGTASVTVTDVAPTVATAASATPNPVTGATTTLSVLGAYTGGESNLTYTWSATGPASVTFSDNGDNTAKNATATFTAAGTYTLKATISNPSGQTVTSTVTVVVNQTTTTVSVTPTTATLNIGGTQTFTASVADQFGAAITGQTFTWSNTGVGSVNSSGVYTAGLTPGTATITVSTNGVSTTASVTVIDAIPTVATAASATPNPVTGATTTLSVLGAYTGGESNLTYTWSATGPASVKFSDNGDNTAKNATATFTKTGTYTFTATITDPFGGSVTSTVTVIVSQTLKSIVVTPSPDTEVIGSGTQTFTAVAKDQFGDPLGTQPTFTWSNTGVGSVNSSGVYTIGTTPGTATIKAASGGVSGTASVTVNNVAPTVATAASATPNPVTGTTTTLSVLGAYTGGESNLTYTWSATGPASVTFSDNGDNTAKNATATFTKTGTYTFTATITDPFGGSVTSTVTVTVSAAHAAITVTPGSATVPINGTQTFTATTVDQFGATLSSQVYTWSVQNGVGTITAGGVYTAGTVPGPETVEVKNHEATTDVTVTVTDAAPTLGSITVNPNPVTGTTATLSVTGSYGGSGSLTYSWTATGPASVNFSGGTSGTPGSAVTTTATFGAAGTYTVNVIVSDIYGSTATKTVTVTVNQTVTAISVSPSAVDVPIGTSKTFTGSATDQFGATMTTQPTFTYSVTGGGTINSSTGVYTAPATAGGTATITATIASPSLSATATANITDVNPTVATAASATPNPVTGTTTNLSVLGAYVGGESNLIYTWSVQSGPSTVAFSVNGTNASKNTTATFNQAGTYVLTVSFTDPASGIGGSQVTVVVNQTGGPVTITPSPASVTIGGTVQFTAAQNDQFGNPLASQPTNTWSVTTGGGTVDSTGLYTAPLTPGTATVKAVSSAGGSATVTVTINDSTPTITAAASATPNPVTGTTTNLSVQGAYTGTGNLTYTWSATGPAAVTYSGNGTNIDNNTTATFTQAGTYVFTVTITDASGTSATSSVTVVVKQTLTTVSISPNSPSISIGTTQQFTASTLDQFGNAMSPAPTLTWAVVVGAGSITTSGLYTAALTPGTSTVKVTSGGLSDTSPVTVTDTPVTVATAASATPNPVTGATTNLSVLGAWNGGESNLSYSWTATGPASVGFAPNGNNAAKNSIATFIKVGTYTLTVTITDGYGGSATSSVTVTVNTVQTILTISPTSASINVGGTKQFTAVATDQFGNAISPQPTFTWTVTAGPGSVSSSGLYTASAAAGTATVKVTGGGQSATASVTVSDVAPTVATAASASPNPVTAKTTTLSVLGAYAGGESNLTYTWSLTTGPAAVTYSANGTNGAKSTTATFTQAGSYTFLVTIATPGGLTVTSSVTVTVKQTATTFTVSPVTSTVTVNGSEQLTADVLDQFGNVLVPQPTITWTLTSGPGAVGTYGLYNAPIAAGTATVTATSGTFSGTCTINVIDGPPTVATAASATPNPVTAKTTALSVLGAYIGGESTLTYTWSATGPAAVTYSVNGTNASKNTTATFTKAGSYTFTVTITSPSGLSTTSSVTVVVNQTVTSVAVTPNPASVRASGTIQFTAVASDQFGNVVSPAPTFTWTTTNGTITSGGLYTAPASQGSATVKATVGSVSGTDPVTITAAGTLSGTVSTSSAAVNLTTEGTLDWDHWGRAVPGLDQKTNGNLITGYTNIGSGTVGAYRTDKRPLSWTNGTPTASSTGNITGVYVAGQGNGFQIMSPALGTTRTLVVYVGGNGAGGTLTATMSDGSVATYTNVQPTQTGVWDAEYTFVYSAATAGATLNVSWVQSTTGSGSVTLSAATLH